MMKHPTPSRARRTKLFALMTAAFAATSVQATNLWLEDFWARDYLDFAQNKGIFQPGATGLTITTKDGGTFALPDLPFMDFTKGSADATSTSIGGAYVVTAGHYFTGTGPTAVPHRIVRNPVYGQTTYQFADVKKRDDFAVERLTKFVVETGGTKAVDISSMSEEEFLDRFGTEVDGETKVVGMHAGTGEIEFSYTNHRGAYYDFRANGIGNDGVFKNGALFTVVDRNEGESSFVADMGLGNFINRTTSGDSGSGYFLYDRASNEWVLVGTLYGTEIGQPTNTIVNHWSQATVDALMAEHRENIALNGGEMTFNAGAVTVDGNDLGTVSSAKDFYLTGGGTLTLLSNMSATEGGWGLVFDAGQRYTVDGSAAYKAAGLDIGEGTEVDWNVYGLPGDSLHKIGKGTLNVNRYQSNTLRLGEGTVNLNTASAFTNIYITSGRGTVVVNADNALASNSYGGIFFSDNGGTLDLNGHDWEVQKIAANDLGAHITNTGAETASVSIGASDKYGFHGTLSGNIDVTASHSSRADSQVLVMDGNADIDGSIRAVNTNLVLQGKAVAHAVFSEPETTGGAFYTEELIEHEGELAENQGKPWMTSNERSSFDQPDWEDRIFRAEAIRLEGSSLTVGRNARVEADIRAENSTVTLGGGAAWRDRYDGSNITDDGFAFRQEMVEGVSQADDTISYTGTMTAKGTTVKSHLAFVTAGLKLDGSSFTDETGSGVIRLLSSGIELKNASKVKADTIVVNELETTISADANSKLDVRTLAVDNSTLTVKDLSSEKSYTIRAANSSAVTLDNWRYRDGNLVSDETSKYSIGTLTADAGDRIESDLTITRLLAVENLSATRNTPLSVLKLTLGEGSGVKASFDDETVSARNYALDTAYKVVEANTFVDNRTDKTVDVVLPGDGIRAESGFIDNGLTITFVEADRPEPEPDTSAVRALLNVRETRLLAMIEEHNKAVGTDAKWQEVAVKTALTNEDAQAGAAALRTQSLARTDATMNRIAQTVDPTPVFSLMNRAVSTRLATRGMKWREHKLRDTTVWADTDVGYLHEDSGRSTKHYGINAGFDKELHTDMGVLTAGALFGAAKLDRTAEGYKDKGTVLTASGYAHWRPNDAFEWQSAIALGWADGDKDVKTDALVEAQSFSDDLLAIQWSNTAKYQIWSDKREKILVRPLVTADIGWFRLSSADSQFFTRESADGIRADLGIGVETEFRDFRGAHVVRALVRKNVVNTGDEAEVKLSGASQTMTYDIVEKHDDAALDLAWYANMKINRYWTVTGNVTGTMSSGTWGAAGSVGLQYRW